MTTPATADPATDLANTAKPCTSEPLWVSGGVNRWGRYEFCIDYRWECGCGHRYGNADVITGHAKHLATITT